MKGNEQAELTPRTCRFCDGRYVYAKGHSRAHAGCPRCQPSLFDVTTTSPAPNAKRI